MEMNRCSWFFYFQIELQEIEDESVFETYSRP